MGQIGKGLDYIKSIPFILKIIEFVILLIAICTIGIFLDKADEKYQRAFDVFGKKSHLQFSMFVVVMAWLIVIALTAVFICGFHERIKFINWPLSVALTLAIWALLLFIAACLTADAARRYNEKVKFRNGDFTLCKILDIYRSDTKCGHVIGGSVCCFIATILFAVDVVVHFNIFRSASPAATPAATVT